jgi:type I restriction enzyme, S subunit
VTQMYLTRIEQLGRVVTGKTPSSESPEEFGSEHPFITPSDIPRTQKFVTPERFFSAKGLAKHKRALLPPKSVCVVCIGATIGKVCTTSSPSFANQQINGIVPDTSRHSPEFVYYLASTLRDALISFAGGSATPILNKSDFSSIKVLVPELQHQQKIAAILSAYDDLIANNQRRITLLERMAEDIYREWFVRLRFPGHEQVKIEKGVPQGWVQRRFGEFCVLKRGYDLPDSAIQPGPYPVIASTSIKAHHKFFKTLPPVITTGRSGSLGDVLYVNAKAWPLNTALYVKDFCGNSPFLIFYTLKNMGLENFNAGAGVPSLNRNHLNGISMVVPQPAIQTAFDAKLSPIFKLKEGLEKQVELLKATRDALLPRLISGKLAVDAQDIRFPPGMAAF